MTERLTLLIRYLKYYFTAAGRHDVHSPFVFSLVENVLRDRGDRPAFGKIGALRKSLLRDTRNVTITDLGAGSLLHKRREKTVKEMAKDAAKPAKYGQLLFRLVEYFQAKSILELGTSLGLSAAYLASASPLGEVLTLEGSPETLRIAGENFAKLELNNISTLTGNFDETLATALVRMPRPDLVFIDGNHRREPTSRYFLQCLPHVHNDTLMIFDDIHWTGEMESAWEFICRHEQVTLTVDLFFLGIVFFKKEFFEKQHFVLRY